MAEQLVVLAFDGASSAETVMGAIQELQGRGLIELDDAVVVSRAPNTERIHLVAQGEPHAATAQIHLSTPGEVKVTQVMSGRRRTAAKGAAIGLLAGWLLGGPLGGAAIGALVGALRDRGIDDGFINELSMQLHPDSSGIFLLVSRADTDKVLEEMRPYKGRVIHTTIDPEVEQALRKALEREA